MGGRSGKGGGRALETPQAVQHEPDHVTLAPLELASVVERDADGRGHGLGVDEVEPAEGDDAEKELGRVARGGVVEAELGADCRQCLLAGGDVLANGNGTSSAQGAALDQTDEVGSGGEKVEVIRYGTGQNGLGRLLARQGPGPSSPDGLPDLLITALQHGVVEFLLGAEEVPRCPS